MNKKAKGNSGGMSASQKGWVVIVVLIAFGLGRWVRQLPDGQLAIVFWAALLFWVLWEYIEKQLHKAELYRLTEPHTVEWAHSPGWFWRRVDTWLWKRRRAEHSAQLHGPGLDHERGWGVRGGRAKSPKEKGLWSGVVRLSNSEASGWIFVVLCVSFGLARLHFADLVRIFSVAVLVWLIWKALNLTKLPVRLDEYIQKRQNGVSTSLR